MNKQSFSYGLKMFGSITVIAGILPEPDPAMLD
jgi:hypothetical protein